MIESALARLRAAEWIPVTAARVLTGVFFCISGGTKLLVPSQFSELQKTMIQSHIPFPHASALFVSLVEFACGGGLILGLLTPLCAVMLMGDMIVAILTNRDRNHPRERAPGVAWMTSCTCLRSFTC